MAYELTPTDLAGVPQWSELTPESDGWPLHDRWMRSYCASYRNWMNDPRYRNWDAMTEYSFCKTFSNHLNALFTSDSRWWQAFLDRGYGDVLDYYLNTAVPTASRYNAELGRPYHEYWTPNGLISGDTFNPIPGQSGYNPGRLNQPAGIIDYSKPIEQPKRRWWKFWRR